jgi:hypothetical protein
MKTYNIDFATIASLADVVSRQRGARETIREAAWKSLYHFSDYVRQLVEEEIARRERYRG